MSDPNSKAAIKARIAAKAAARAAAYLARKEAGLLPQTRADFIALPADGEAIINGVAYVNIDGAATAAHPPGRHPKSPTLFDR